MKNKNRIETNTWIKTRNYCNVIFGLVGISVCIASHNRLVLLLILLCMAIIILNSLITKHILKEVEVYAASLEANILQIMQKGEMQEISHYEDSLLSKSQMQLSRLCDCIGRMVKESKQDKEVLQSLVSDIAHQVKTPIANAMLYITALQKADLSIQKREHYLKILSEQITKLDFLMDNLLKMSRLEVGIFLLEPKVLPIQETLAEALGSIAIKAEEKDISISVECEEELTALHDKKWTGEVFENVLDNAIKYTTEHGNISISVKRNEFYTIVEIADTGIGIPQNEIPKIFQRFYRGKNVRNKQGVGIGLYLVREILSMDLGQILKDAGNAEIPASDYTDLLIQFQNSSGIGKLISQYMYSNRQFPFFSILICITDQFDEDEGHKQGR